MSIFLNETGTIMKIQYKAALIITLIGVVIVTLLSISYNIYSYKIIIDKEMNSIKDLSDEVALHLESHLKAKTAISSAFSSAPLIRDALLQSNSEFAVLPYDEREQEVDRLNQKWMSTEDINDPFIQVHLTNQVAEYLKYQQIIMPEEYGEIFLTNRYGVMIATTGKLTTLAHAHKYWWLAGYHDGQGRIFLDDRGFDSSVQGYVLGIVIPIKDKNEIIGILKSNVNITGPITNAIQKFVLGHSSEIKLVRTSGLIVFESGIVPLSTRVDKVLINILQKKERGTEIVSINNENYLIAYSPVVITMGSEYYGFGGSRESIDHIKGNEGDAWHIVISISQESATETARQVTFVIIFAGIIFTFIIAAAAMFLSKWLVRPIIHLADTAKIIGKGNLNIKAEVQSNDEIGSLAKTLNTMTVNLQNTMASRNELEESNRELQNALDNIKTLSGLIPICAKCKKIRDDKGYWNQIEAYISSHSHAQFSHGLCPDCAEELYGNEEWYKKK